MTDTYFSASSLEALTAMFAQTSDDGDKKVYANVIGPMTGRDLVEGGTDGNGNAFPDIPAAGDPGTWYVCIRSDEAIPLPAGVSLCPPETGQAVLGLWAWSSVSQWGAIWTGRSRRCAPGFLSLTRPA